MLKNTSLEKILDIETTSEYETEGVVFLAMPNNKIEFYYEGQFYGIANNEPDKYCLKTLVFVYPNEKIRIEKPDYRDDVIESMEFLMGVTKGEATYEEMQNLFEKRGYQFCVGHLVSFHGFDPLLYNKITKDENLVSNYKLLGTRNGEVVLQ